VLELDGELEYKSSQFAFLWLPGIGEKPFSIAHSSPLTFFIKDRGHVSGRICRLQPGEIVYVRGVYGKSAPLTTKKRAYILAGGTGIAVAHKLVKELAAHGTATTIFYATSHLEDVLVPPGLDETAELHVIPDDGQPARAIYEWQREIENGKLIKKLPGMPGGDDAIRPGRDAGENSWALYTIGPPDYMRRAVEIAEANGTDPEDIYLSVETATHCGVGLCGECECGGKLTCQEGTFFTKAFLDSQGIKVSELPSHSKHGVNKNVISIFPHE
jgi:dihydroorotate dehydrogenase (NAD+) catalytic subunit